VDSGAATQESGPQKARSKPSKGEKPQPEPSFEPLTPQAAAQQPTGDEAAMPTWLAMLIGASLALNLGFLVAFFARRYRGLYDR
jgi:ABC-type branched-subunit amino acid transport system permease subunit